MVFEIDWELAGREHAIRECVKAKLEHEKIAKELEEFVVIECNQALYDLQEKHWDTWVHFQQRYHRLEELGIVRNEHFTCQEFADYARKIEKEYNK